MLFVLDGIKGLDLAGLHKGGSLSTLYKCAVLLVIVQLWSLRRSEALALNQ